MLTSGWTPVFRRFCRHRLAVVSLFVLTALILMAVFAPLIAPYAPTKPTGGFSKGPDAAHILGTDQVGRDLSLIHI